MTLDENPCLFAGNPLDRASEKRIDPAWIKTRLDDPDSLLLPLYKGDPLITGGAPAWLSTAARREFSQRTKPVFLGLKNQRAYFAINASDAASPETAPFAEIGVYTPLRQSAAMLGDNDIAIIGQARWLLDWHYRHRHCAVCGALTDIKDGGAKRQCPDCSAEHFPRSDPVAIILATHGDACLLGRGPHFPPGFLSALAGYIEVAETPEECAVREVYEEAGVRLTDVRYQFSQPWPFPSSLMMGFIADAEARDLNLDTKEIEEACWVDRADILKLLNGEEVDGVFLPPRFTIARQLLERWAGD